MEKFISRYSHMSAVRREMEEKNDREKHPHASDCTKGQTIEVVHQVGVQIPFDVYCMGGAFFVKRETTQCPECGSTETHSYKGGSRCYR